MSSLDTAQVVEDKTSAVAPGIRRVQPNGWRLSAIAADIATLGTGTLVAAVFNAGLVFLIPKLVSVEDYGYWKLFTLYAGYVGFLHFGYADGALVRWAGREWDDFHHEIRPAFDYLFWQHVITLLPICLIAAFLLHGPSQFLTIAVAAFSLIMNEATLLQFGLQDAKIFGPVAISTAAAPGLFVVFVLLWALKWQSDYREVAGFYMAAWLVALIVLLAWAKPWSGGRVRVSARRQAKDWLTVGWPIVVANTGVSLIQFADRFAVSWAATIQNFAQYSLAGSAMGVPITAIQACSSVFFSHLAGVKPEGKRRLYGFSSRLILVAWAVLLPYYFVLDVFVRRFLPRYAASLQYARVLLLGIPFWAVIQILQMNYAYLSGGQKRFLARTMLVLVLGFGVASFVAFHFGSLQVVAALQVIILACWWLFNEFGLRSLTGATVKDWVGFGGVYALVGATYWVATSRGSAMGAAVGLYYLSLAIIVILSCGRELRFVFGEMWLGQAPAGAE